MRLLSLITYFNYLSIQQELWTGKTTATTREWSLQSGIHAKRKRSTVENDFFFDRCAMATVALAVVDRQAFSFKSFFVQSHVVLLLLSSFLGGGV
jgi:hypothetical protein